MRKPYVSYSLDETITKFIRKVVGEQDCMFWFEILVGAGLASRELTLLDGELTIHLCASAALKSRLEKRGQAKKVDRAKDRLP
jgi:hypothetical protein